MDTPVRGVVYEAAGSLDPELLAGGAAAVREGVRALEHSRGGGGGGPGDREGWLAAMTAAVGRLL